MKKGVKRLVGSGGGVSVDNGLVVFSYGIWSYIGVVVVVGIYRDGDEGEG